MPLRERQCSLRGVNFIFDAYIYQLQAGLGHGGVGKMWAEIVPHMARAVTAHGGQFTHCQYGHHIDLAYTTPRNCKYALTGVPALPGDKKVFLSMNRR